MDKLYLESLIEDTKKLTILYVEDSESSRKVSVTFLKNFFKEVITAVDGIDGLAKFKEYACDVVITDINMPNMNGLELIGSIKKLNQNIPVVILSAHKESSYFLESIHQGVEGYLFKPFDMEQFSIVMGKIIQKMGDRLEQQEQKKSLESLVIDKTSELEYRFYHDVNTTLPNEIMLEADIESTHYNYMLLLDIAHFSIFNKEYGKDFGNDVIKKTAEVLLSLSRESAARLYKIESDRFVVLVDTMDRVDVSDFCQCIVKEFNDRNIIMNDLELHITFNIGVDRVRNNKKETMINCEYALDEAKKSGAKHYELFSEENAYFTNEKEAVKWLRITRHLISDKKIEPFFQPIKNIKTGKIEKYEVLARGIYENEIVSPAKFVNAAEKLGLSVELTKIVISKSFKFFQDKKEDFSINITEQDLLDGYLEVFITQMMDEYKIKASRVTFEILENITIAHSSEIITQELNKLKSMGFKIAVDDFGIENSNFSRLLEINMDYIKIDGIFIKNLYKCDNSSKNKTITQAIVNLAKTLGIKTVAEYVECEELYDIIKDCGIDYAQGYYVGKPQRELIEE